MQINHDQDAFVYRIDTNARGYATNTKIDLSHKIWVENEIPPER
jgi:hypothetical protein